MEQPIVSIQNVSKKYRYGKISSTTFQESLKLWWAGKTGRIAPEELHTDNPYFYALKDIDLAVRRGEKLGIIGHNGAGKSTLLKILGRITTPTDGTIDLYGRVASLLEVGTGFDPELTGRENIYLNGAILGMSREEIDGKIDDIIEFSEIGEFIDTPVKRYSSGMYVKLGFAVAAHLDNEILIMDEVLAVGDMEFQKKCLDRMKSLSVNEGRTILYVSHNMNTIRSICDRCIVLEEGHILYDGDVDEAISIYLGLDEELPVKYTYSSDYRPYDESLRANRRFEMEELEYCEGSGPLFSSDQKQKLRLRVKAFKSFERVGFRFEVWAQDDSKIGTMLAGSFADFPEGTSTVEITIDPTHLTSGQYRADLVAYCFDENGTEDILDGVYPGILFQINNELSEENYLDWHHQYWGPIRLHDLQVKK
ncbi:MAG: ABC transporter ATP-binding protein [Oscillospiraceae bacterium]|nr:ABC transporter ATP-binding protein [Oscillospiraceae bacterium]